MYDDDVFLSVEASDFSLIIEISNSFTYDNQIIIKTEAIDCLPHLDICTIVKKRMSH